MSHLARIDDTIEGTAVAVPSPIFSADHAIAVYDETQRFISHIIGDPKRWPKSKDGKPMAPAVSLMKLWGPLGCEDEFLSTDETTGLPGVRRTQVGTRTLKKRRIVEDEFGEKSELVEEQQIPIYEFTCTVRVTSRRLGASVTVASEISSNEDAKVNVATSFLRQQCATRARKTALKVLTGLDETELTDKKALPTLPLDIRVLMGECVRRGLCPDDRLAFLDFCRESVRGCGDLGDKPLMSHVQALHRYLSETQKHGARR